MPRKLSRKGLVKKLDTIFSQYIRLRNTKGSIAECVTCGKKDHWKKMQAGHFVGRKHYSTRWNTKNVQVQCIACNVYRYGEQYKYGKWLDNHYGIGTTDELFKLGSEIVKFTNYELEEKIDYYKYLVEELL